MASTSENSVVEKASRRRDLETDPLWMLNECHQRLLRAPVIFKNSCFATQGRFRPIAIAHGNLDFHGISRDSSARRRSSTLLSFRSIGAAEIERGLFRYRGNKLLTIPIFNRLQIFIEIRLVRRFLQPAEPNHALDHQIIMVAGSNAYRA